MRVGGTYRCGWAWPVVPWAAGQCGWVAWRWWRVCPLVNGSALLSYSRCLSGAVAPTTRRVPTVMHPPSATPPTVRRPGEAGVGRGRPATGKGEGDEGGVMVRQVGEAGVGRGRPATGKGEGGEGSAMVRRPGEAGGIGGGWTVDGGWWHRVLSLNSSCTEFGLPVR